MSLDCGNLDRSSGAVLPTLTEVVRLIASIGHAKKINDFSIKPIEQHSFRLTRFSRHTRSQPSPGGATLSTAAEVGRIQRSATRARPQNGRAVDAEALASQGSESSSSDNNGGLSDSDLEELSSDDDGCLNEDEQGRSSKHSAMARPRRSALTYRHTRKKASLGSGSLASSRAGLGPQYARAGTWVRPRGD
ncbi:MAG: hypothetical protein M1813_005378 [Trichoglossum hirsutum]|nr:MAG: hypothetical protein M1813_005378 [Trichoglossum hirsutum]